MPIFGFPSLAIPFFLSSHLEMERTDPNRLVETILAAPGWVRVGITAPTSHMRVEAAHELARVILEDMSRDKHAANIGTSGRA